MQAFRIFLFYFFILFFSLTGCKDPDNLGLDVLPAGDITGLSFTDSISLVTSVVPGDSIPTTSTNTYHLIGGLNENVFGKSKAGFYSQLIVINANPSFGTTPVCDSVVLTLVLSGYYGDTLSSTHQFSIYELNQVLNKDSTLYSNQKPQTLGLLGTYTTSDIRPTDSVTINGVKAPQLAIRLDPVLVGDRFLTAGSVYADAATFNNYFKGIYIEDSITSGSGCILYSNINNDTYKCKLGVYYHNDAADSLYYEFLLNGGAHFSYFEHDYSTAVFGNNFNDTIFGKNLCYVQSMAGVKTKIDFPYLNSVMQQGSIAVNNAQLIIKADDSNTALYSLHNKLGLTGIDSVGKSYFLPDNIDNPVLFGGDLSTDKTYTFNITRYFQQILAGSKTNYGLFLVSSGSAVNANRTVVGGSQHPALQMKFKLTFTKIN